VCVRYINLRIHSLTACSLSCVMDSHHLPGIRKVVWIHCYQNQRTFDVAFKPKSKCQRNQCNINRYSIKNGYTLCFTNCQIFMNTWNCMIITLITVTSIYPPDKDRCYQCNVRVDGSQWVKPPCYSWQPPYSCNFWHSDRLRDFCSCPRCYINWVWQRCHIPQKSVSAWRNYELQQVISWHQEGGVNPLLSKSKDFYARKLHKTLQIKLGW